MKTIVDRTLGSMRLAGKSLWDVLKKNRRRELDIQATIGVGRKSFQARVVGIRNQETGHWHLYVTNINAVQANAEFIVYLYRKRWQVEIVFKMLRSVGRLDQLTSSDEGLMRTQIWAAVLRVALGQLVALVTRQKQGLTKGEVRNLKAQRVWTELHGELLSQMVQPDQPQDLFKWFFKYAQDINRWRWTLFDFIAKLDADGLPVFR